MNTLRTLASAFAVVLAIAPTLGYAQAPFSPRVDDAACGLRLSGPPNALSLSMPFHASASPVLSAPATPASDTIKGTPDEKIIKSNALPENKQDQIKSIDSTRYNVFGDLLDDDTLYNPKEPLWIPIVEVPAFNILLGAFNRYVANSDFGRISLDTWKYNIENGWEWDVDRFGMNFLAHPYTGGLQFTSARSNGYNFWESIPFAVGGSLLWEYFGENTRPSYNDVINTPISGAFYGEIFYRLGSDILDDRTSGFERFGREFIAAVLSPTRFVNRAIQGRLSRTTTEQVYQQEPVNVELSAGARIENDGSLFGTGPTNLNLNTQLDYGYPLEKRHWKPYDYFQIRGSLNFGVGRKIVENVSGYGVLFGTTTHIKDLELMVGMFQHYDYFDNSTFELGTIGIGGGVMSKYSLSKDAFLLANAHLAIMPLAGNSTRFGPDTTQLRDYIYGGGLEGKIDVGINLGWGSAQLVGYYFWVHTYVGTPGDNFIGILKPRITLRIVQNLNIGFEELVYSSTRNVPSLGNFGAIRTEQRVYLMLNVGNFKL